MTIYQRLQKGERLNVSGEFLDNWTLETVTWSGTMFMKDQIVYLIDSNKNVINLKNFSIEEINIKFDIIC